MIDANELHSISENAAMIVNGYAFTTLPDGNIQVIELTGDNNACIMQADGTILETNMNDIQLTLVGTYWTRNKQIMEDAQHA